MFRYVATLSLLFFAKSSFSQMETWSTHSNDSSRSTIQQFYDLAFQYLPHQKDTAMQHIQETARLATESGDSSWIVRSYRVKGEILYLLGRHVEAISCLEFVQRIAERHSFESELLNIQTVLGRAYLFLGRYDKALQLLTSSQELATAMGDKEFVINSMNAVAITYYKLKDYKHGLHLFLAAIDSAKGFDSEFLHTLRANAALCYAYLGRYETARQYLKASSERCGAFCSNSDHVNISYANGVVAELAGQPIEAERHFKKSFTLASQANDIRFQLDNINMLASLYTSQGRLALAESFLIDGERMITTGSQFNLENIKIYKRLADFYLDKEDFVRACKYQNLYIAMRDSIYSENLINSLMKAEAEFHLRENQARLASQERVIVLNQELLERQRRLNILSWVFIMCSAIAILTLFKHHRRMKVLNSMLDERVRQRTKELEYNRRELASALGECELATTRAFHTTLQHTSSVRGLCQAALSEATDPISQAYFKRIAGTLSHIEHHIRNVSIRVYTRYLEATLRDTQA